MASAPQKRAAVAAGTRWGMTAAAPVTWTVASWTPAVNLQIAWRSAWNAVGSASHHEIFIPFYFILYKTGELFFNKFEERQGKIFILALLIPFI